MKKTIIGDYVIIEGEEGYVLYFNGLNGQENLGVFLYKNDVLGFIKNRDKSLKLGEVRSI